MKPRHFPEFKRQVTEMLLRLGATPTKLGLHDVELETKVGPLDLTAYDGWLAARFVDVPRARALLNPAAAWTSRLNPVSGKWNFHFDDSVTPEIAVEYIGRHLREVLMVEVQS
jgi:hypothetical protein